MDQNEKIYYTRKFIYNPLVADEAKTIEEKMRASVVTVEGKVTGMTVRDINGASGAFKCAFVKLCCVMPDRAIRRNFGDDIADAAKNNKQRVYFEVSYTGFAAADLEKEPLAEGTSILVMATNLEKDKFQTQNGNAMFTLKGRGVDKPSKMPVRDDSSKAAPAQQEAQPAQSSAPQQSGEKVCSVCGKAVDDAVYDYSNKKFGKTLCMACQKAAKDSASTPAAAPAQPAAGAKCSACGISIANNVLEYSMKKYGKALCRSCQNGAAAPAAVSAPSSEPAPAPKAAKPVELFLEDVDGDLDSLDDFNPFI